jgi:hypothetical protein
MKSKVKRFSVLKDDGTISTFEAKVMDGKESYVLARTKDDVLKSDEGRVDSCANVYATKRVLGAVYVMYERYHVYIAFKTKKNGYPATVKRYSHDNQKWIDRVHDNPHMTKQAIIDAGLAEGHILITPVRKKKKSDAPRKPRDPPASNITAKPRRDRGRGALGRLFTAKLLPPPQPRSQRTGREK